MYDKRDLFIHPRHIQLILVFNVFYELYIIYVLKKKTKLKIILKITTLIICFIISTLFQNCSTKQKSTIQRNIVKLNISTYSYDELLNCSVSSRHSKYNDIKRSYFSSYT